jgi:hypothetical protein
MGLKKSYFLMQWAGWVAAVEPCPAGPFQKVKFVLELQRQLVILSGRN